MIKVNGHKIGYCEYGDPNGFPVFYFHGGQESRLSGSFLDLPAKNKSLRIIAPDRPGFGLSDFQINRKLLDWPNDVSALANHLSIDKFSIFGLSGGGPHVLACALKIPQRLEKVTVVSGPAPYRIKGISKGMWFPVKLLYWFASMRNDFMLRKAIDYDYKSLLKNPESRIKQMKQGLPDPDKQLLNHHPEIANNFVKGSLEGYKNGINGAVWEWRLYSSPWGFNLGNITKSIDLWYGENDVMVPALQGKYLDKELPNSRLFRIKNEAHFSLIHNHINSILEGLTPDD